MDDREDGHARPPLASRCPTLSSFRAPERNLPAVCNALSRDLMASACVGVVRRSGSEGEV